MPSTCDFHIHTYHLKCANETMTVPAIVRRCEELGLQEIAITDHLNAPKFLDQHLLIKRDLAEVRSDLTIHFGVEVNVIDQHTGQVSITPEQIEQAGFKVVIGGVHSSYHDRPDKLEIIELQQRLMMKVVANPLIDVLVHPWWFGLNEFRAGGPMEWFRDMSDIPEDYARELGQAAVAHNTAVEANASAIWNNSNYSDEFKAQYAEYIAAIARAGAKISVSSDAHDIKQLAGVHLVADILAQHGIAGEKLWRPIV